VPRPSVFKSAGFDSGLFHSRHEPRPDDLHVGRYRSFIKMHSPSTISKLSGTSSKTKTFPAPPSSYPYCAQSTEKKKKCSAIQKSTSASLSGSPANPGTRAPHIRGSLHPPPHPATRHRHLPRVEQTQPAPTPNRRRRITKSQARPAVRCPPIRSPPPPLKPDPRSPLPFAGRRTARRATPQKPSQPTRAAAVPAAGRALSEPTETRQSPPPWG
jgi:hypothetical protein